jgi:hypothetical protein
MKDSMGFVHLKGGAVYLGAAAPSLGTLPSGYRPEQALYYLQTTDSGELTTLSISTGGVMTLSVPGDSVSTIYLDGITFKAA